MKEGTYNKVHTNILKCPRCHRPIAARNSDKLQVLKCPGCGSVVLHPAMPL